MVETLELGRKLEDAVGLGLEAIIVNGVWPDRFSAADVKKLRAASRNGHDPAAAAPCAPRSPSTTARSSSAAPRPARAESGTTGDPPLPVRVGAGAAGVPAARRLAGRVALRNVNWWVWWCRASPASGALKRVSRPRAGIDA